MVRSSRFRCALLSCTRCCFTRRCRSSTRRCRSSARHHTTGTVHAAVACAVPSAFSPRRSCRPRPRPRHAAPGAAVHAPMLLVHALLQLAARCSSTRCHSSMPHLQPSTCRCYSPAHRSSSTRPRSSSCYHRLPPAASRSCTRCHLSSLDNALPPLVHTLTLLTASLHVKAAHPHATRTPFVANTAAAKCCDSWASHYHCTQGTDLVAILY